ncbi:MAG: flagellar biosynthesis anti-sigma factor FlgM [Bdellovibrionaceae bacterium]|nr:flagellar biosynthesis anti-sigma factor FlgM [Pseudobdellovibrionaceae bacterium]MDW8190654.1 flagellar biosynthesis anti-sigma factor FlgM [Pseudobdellovibrionaceae bacterium]
MKITHNKIGKNLNITDTTNIQSAQKSKAPKSSDIATQSKKETPGSFQISSQGRLFSQAKEVAEKTPEINREKVERLKQLYRDGKYQVDSEVLADKMLKEELDLAQAIS